MTQPDPYMRRRGLIDWLAQYGFTSAQVDQFIRDGVIPQKHFATAKQKALSRRPRAYYARDKVALALDLPLTS